jgi:hypothetical protein
MFDLLINNPTSFLPARLLIHQDVVSIYSAIDKNAAEVANTAKTVRLSILPFRSNWADAIGVRAELGVSRNYPTLLTSFL